MAPKANSRSSASRRSPTGRPGADASATTAAPHAQAFTEEARTVYVSITGLRTHGWWTQLRFWRHAIPSMIQARRSPGNLHASARTVDGVRHTLTVWENETAMRRFLYRGAHRKAIRVFHAVGTGLTCGYETDRVPTWDEVPAIWRERGRNYTGHQ